MSVLDRYYCYRMSERLVHLVLSTHSYYVIKFIVMFDTLLYTAISIRNQQYFATDKVKILLLKLGYYIFNIILFSYSTLYEIAY